MANKETMHAGHRQRLKNRFIEDGLEHFDEHQVLELMLFYCIPRQDTNPIAHALMEHFGSLSQVMTAPIAELQKVSGMGESAATFISLLTYPPPRAVVSVLNRLTWVQSFGKRLRFLRWTACLRACFFLLR